MTLPACGYGKDAFSLSVGKTGKLYAYCFGGNCTLVQLQEAIAKVLKGQLIQLAQVGRADPQKTVKQKTWAFSLWTDSVPLGGTKGEMYFASRQLSHVVESEALRFHPAVRHMSGIKLPAVIALVVDVTGMPLAIHRTYLAADGNGKAAVSPVKASLGHTDGGVIRLSKLDSHSALVVGEGIETAASAGLSLGGLPAWAALSAGNLAKLTLPPLIAHVIIAVDPDHVGKRAAMRAARRWRLEGRKVQLAIPDGTGDFNDLLCANVQEATHD